MLSEQSTTFPKQIKLDDYEPATESNLVRIMQTSNLLLGNGGRSSQTSIILAKCLHLLDEESILKLKGKRILEFGCGVGLLGIYLAAIGINVVMSDVPAIKDMVQRNVNLNRQNLKASTNFTTINWKNIPKSIPNNQNKQAKQFSQEQKMMLKLQEETDLTLACESGSLEDLESQLGLIGKEGMIVAFSERQSYVCEQFLNCRQLQEYLVEKDYGYETLENYHPDYVDDRVKIYRIWK